MAMPISNTHLRVPRGFGALLEGLTREILRDQPKDIPKYAAQYFEALLRQREERGTDPSEWAAKLEDRYYNNHSFKTSVHASRTTVSNKNTQDSTVEDCSGQSEEDVSMTTMKTKHLTTSEEGEESSPILTQAESAKGPPGSSPDPTASTQADGLLNEINNSSASNSESESHEVQLLRETENTKMQESDAGGEEDDDDDQKHTDQGDKAGNLEDEIADTASILEEKTEQNVAFESSEIRLQTPVSQLEITEQKQEQADYDADGCTTSDDIKEYNDKALVEISFEDVPENQQSKNNELGINVEIMEKTDTISDEQEAQLEEKRQDDDDEENISIHDNSVEESVDIIDTVHQSTTKADNLVSEDTNNINNDENSSLKDKFEKYDLTEDTIMGEGETKDQEIEHQKSVDKDAASDLAQLADSNVNIFEEQGEILEKGEDDLSEEEEQYQDETLEKYFTISQEQHSEEEELLEEALSDSEDKEGHSSHEQANVNPDLEEWPDKEDTGQQEEQQDSPDQEGQTNDKQEECSRPQEEEDIMDIPLDDPEANRAAAKIQAGFRGHMTRKKMKPEDKTEGEEVSSSGDVLSSRQGGTETGGSRPVGSDDTSVPEQ